MGLKLEAGKFYRTRDGRKVGPMTRHMDIAFVTNCDDGCVWKHDGSCLNRTTREIYGDLIAEWTDGPVRTVTTVRKELVSGKFGIVHLSGHDTGFAQIRLEAGDQLKTWFTAAELRAAIATLTEIAQVMEEQ